MHRFYIIDNNSTSTHGCDLNALGEDVVVWHWAERPSLNQSSGNQMIAYQHFLPRVRAVWLALIDVDEYIYAVRGRLSDVLRELPRNVSQLCMPWLTFGTSGQMRQPPCVTASNVYRKHLYHTEATGKCIQRTSSIQMAMIHRPLLHNETWNKRLPGACLCPDLQSWCRSHLPSSSYACGPNDGATGIGHKPLSSHLVRLHHYVSQSHDMMRHKQARGDADLYRKHRNRLYWARQELDNNVELDTTLRNHALAACRTPSVSSRPPAPRPIIDTTTLTLAYNTWDGLDIVTHALGGDGDCATKVWSARECQKAEERTNKIIAKEAALRITKAAKASLNQSELRIYMSRVHFQDQMKQNRTT